MATRIKIKDGHEGRSLDLERVHELREAAGLSITELAEKVSETRYNAMSRSDLSRILGGTVQHTRADVVQALAIALQVSADELLGLRKVKVPTRKSERIEK